MKAFVLSVFTVLAVAVCAEASVIPTAALSAVEGAVKGRAVARSGRVGVRNAGRRIANAFRGLHGHRAGRIAFNVGLDLFGVRSFHRSYNSFRSFSYAPRTVIVEEEPAIVEERTIIRTQSSRYRGVGTCR